MLKTSGGIAESLPYGIGFHNPETGEILETNGELCNLLRVPDDHLVGTTLSQYTRTSATDIDTVFQTGFTEDCSPTLHCDFVTGDGNIRALELTFSLHTSDDGEYIISTVRKTPETEQLTELKRIQRLLHGAMLSGNVSWWEVDIETMQMDFHENKSALLGYSASDFEEYADYVDVIHPDDQERVTDALDAHIAGDTDHFDVEYRIQTIEGDYRWTRDLAGVTSYTNNQSPKTITGVSADISTRKDRESQLEKRNTELALLNQVIRHDIKNDMNIIMGWSALLDDAVGDEYNEYISRIQSSAQHVVSVTDSIKDLVSFIKNGNDLQVEPTNLTEAIQYGQSQATESFESATIEVNAPETCHVQADNMVNSVIRNILTNAILHNDTDNPEVDVTVVEGDVVQVRIADNGPGITNEIKHVLFEKNQKGEESMGGGIGLYLVEQLMVAYGGDVWVEDNNPRGAVFVLEFDSTDTT